MALSMIHICKIRKEEKKRINEKKRNRIERRRRMGAGV